MKQLFNLDDDFEQFLSNAAEQQRMYPSDRVWRNIDANLRSKNDQRWPALGFASLLIGALITAGLILVHPDKDLFSGVVKHQPQPTTTTALGTAEAPSNAVFARGSSQDTPASLYAFGKPSRPNPAAITAVNSVSPFDEAPRLTVTQIDAPAITASAPTGPTHPIQLSAKLPLAGNIAISNFDGADASFAEAAHDAVTQQLAQANNANDESQAPTMTAEAIEKEQQLLSAQLELNKIAAAAKPKLNRWNLQFYASPSISYRFVTEAKNNDVHNGNTAPLSPNLTGRAENFMRQRPDLGLEAGAAVLFSVTNNFRVKAGLQVNFRQYAIEAYKTETQQSHLILNYSKRNDTLYQMSSLSSNTPSGEAATLNNQFWQVAIPIGFDLKLTNSKRANLYVSGSIQPTYQINTNTYLLSSNYAHYLQQADIIRRFNVNTALEAFVSFKAGGLNWQAGPQIRYQLKPITVSAYPIQQNLIDYGFKVGVVKTLH